MHVQCNSDTHHIFFQIRNFVPEASFLLLEINSGRYVLRIILLHSALY